MQFKNPEIFYFLALLIIPILVHLFQLQKFVKTDFTNVAFLQKIIQQNRKSSQIKKWLILATRLLLFLAILFTFSQPYFSNKKASLKQHNFIYLDNSLSTNSEGKKGNLLKIYYDLSDDNLTFSVKPGVLNYTGLLMIEKLGRQLQVRQLNRASIILKILEQDHPGYIGKFDVVNGIYPNDHYIDFYLTHALKEGE